MSERIQPIRLAMLWHLHQPDVSTGADGAPRLPWARLHALRTYADLFDALDRHPDIRCTLDVDVGLLETFCAYEEGRAPEDPFLRTARREARELTLEERRLIVGAFLDFRRDVLARDLPRLHELAALRGEHGERGVPTAVVERFDEQALRDLQMLFHLAWCGALLRADGRVRSWIEKGRGYTEEDKGALLDVQAQFLGGIAATVRSLAAAGHVEFATGPRFQPIVPLVCDLAAAHESDPNLKLPNRGLTSPEDVVAQLHAARDGMRAIVGREPLGGWAPAGAVSEAALAAFARAGWSWVASDESVLFASLGEPGALGGSRRGRQLYRGWRRGDGPIVWFRDAELSTTLAEDYGAWSPGLAAADLLHRLKRIRSGVAHGASERTVLLAVGVESAWDDHVGGCVPFLDALFERLSAERASVRTVRVDEAADDEAIASLPGITAGSSEDGGLSAWIGSPAANRAWELLADTRAAVATARGEPRFDDPAWRSVFAAEGGDWYRWFSDPVPLGLSADLDACFRSHLIRAWEASGSEPPDRLNDPVRIRREDPSHAPAGPVTPTLDGRVGDWFEWLAAGRIEVAEGVVDAAIAPVRSLRFGGDGRHLYVRLDPTEPAEVRQIAGAVVRVVFPGWPDRTVSMVVPTSGLRETGVARVAVDRIVEIAVSVDAMPADGAVFRFHVEIETPAGARQRIPDAGALELPAGEDQERELDWHV